MKTSTIAIWGLLACAAVGMFVLAPQLFRKKPERPRAQSSDSDFLAESRAKRQKQFESMLPHQVRNDGFVSSEACRQCHKEQFESWHDSYHRTMTQVASPKTVIAPFSGVRLESRGREYYLSREGESYFVTMADPDWEAGAQANGVDLETANPPIVKREIVMTTGSHHMQSYWVSSKTKNMLRQVPWTYLVEDQRWVPREDIFVEPPDAERHLVVWNDNCIVCHAVAGEPGFDVRKLTVDTQVAELGISCEACHGPGKPHIDFQSQKLEARSGKDPVINPADCDPKISAEICGQCHSFFEPHNSDEFGKGGYSYRAGGDLAASHNLKSYAKSKELGIEFELGSYWTDGTCRVAGREYTALVESPCFKNGPMTCISCHSLHTSAPNDQLAARMETNDACLQCHTDFATKIAEHTHHAADSTGSLCYNCHMPHTSYGVMKAMRSHRVQSPQVVPKDQSDHPNACNLCHLDKSLLWTSNKLAEWYQQKQIELDPEEREVSAALLWLLRGDASQRAVASWHMNWKPALEASGDKWQLPFLAQLLTDDYSAVRYAASRAMRRYEVFPKLNYDYVGPPEDRERSKQQAVSFWSKNMKTENVVDGKGLLLDPQSGDIDKAKLMELLKRQDKRPVLLPE